MHEIVINGRFLTRRVTGVERYGRELLHYIGSRCRVERPTRSLNGPAGHAWEQLILPGRMRANSLLWSPANTGPLIVRDHVLTIHDISPLEHAEWFQPGFATWYRLFLPILARRVRRIIVPSGFIRRKVMARFGFSADRVRIVAAGVDASNFHPMSVSPDMGRYILFVGSLEPRKNLQALLQAWEGIQQQYTEISLVIAGAGGRAFRQLPRAASPERTHWVGYVPEAELPRMYAGAELFVLPSVDEGFGLTALEAMACGAPVIVSDGGALPEVVGDAAKIFRLADPEGLCKAMSACLSSPGLRAELKEKGPVRAKLFSWRTSADLLWENLNEA